MAHWHSANEDFVHNRYIYLLMINNINIMTRL